MQNRQGRQGRAGNSMPGAQRRRTMCSLRAHGSRAASAGLCFAALRTSVRDPRAQYSVTVPRKRMQWAHV